MQTPALNHVALHVTDLQRSQDFYEDVLQLKRIERPNFRFAGKWYRLGRDQELHLICRGPAPDQPPQRDNHFALLVDDLDRWEQHLIRARADFQPRKTRPDGALQIILIDPDGHHIELCTRPPSARGSA